MDPFETLTATQSPVDPFGTPPATPRPAADVADFVNALWSRGGARGARHWSAEGATGGEHASAGGACSLADGGVAGVRAASLFAPSPRLRKSIRAAPTRNVTVTYFKNTFAMFFRSMRMNARARAFTDIHRQTARDWRILRKLAKLLIQNVHVLHVRQKFCSSGLAKPVT